MMKGKDRHLARLRRLSGPQMVREVGGVLYVSADMIRAETFRLISEGAISGEGHVPSKPGDPPNRDTGHLQAHLEAVQTGPLTAEVRSNADYAAALEFGTSKMGERPSMRPARDKMEPKIHRLFSERLGNLVKGSAR